MSHNYEFDKPKDPVCAMTWLGIGFFFLGGVSYSVPFFPAGIFLGVGRGVVMPLPTATVFSLSQPRFRARNTNLAITAFQGGFFMGPILGGAALLHWDDRVLCRVGDRLVHGSGP